MKYFILTTFLFSLSVSSFGQGFKLVGLNENFERVDSVIFGFADNATLGVDALLGEVNIFNRPTPAYDMRVVQRDSTNFSCSTTFVYDIQGNIVDTAKHYFPTNFDSKINFRSNRDTSFLNRLFEIKFPSLNLQRFYFSFLSQNQIFAPISQNQDRKSVV